MVSVHPTQARFVPRLAIMLGRPTPTMVTSMEDIIRAGATTAKMRRLLRAGEPDAAESVPCEEVFTMLDTTLAGRDASVNGKTGQATDKQLRNKEQGRGERSTGHRPRAR